MKWKLRNRTKKMARMGDVRSFFCKSENEFTDYLKVFFELHRKRWNSTDTPSHFNDERCRKFYLDVTPVLFAKKQMDLFVMNVGENTVAMLYSFRTEKTCLIQLLVHDTDYNRFSPSIIMQHRFVEEVFDNGIEMLDFGDYYPYKEMWARDSKDKLSLEIYSRQSVRSVFFYYFTRCVDPLRGLLRSIGPLRKLIIRLRQKREQSQLVGSSKTDNQESKS
jgi:CelD/BcsL family acetyltransferase involved in cellulose biosynthesis